jgi:hypothetical protein
VNGFRFGASDSIAPTFRSRLAQPSSRFPIPGANELSTVQGDRTIHLAALKLDFVGRAMKPIIGNIPFK